MIGEGWVEVEQLGALGATVSVAGNQLSFDDTSGVINRPLVSRSFSPVSTGTLQWDFDFDWARTAVDPGYELWTQLGDGAVMSDNSQDVGAGVNLIWTRINGAHQSLGYHQGGVTTALAVMSGPAPISVVADLDAQTYSVAVDGAMVQSGIPFDTNVSLDTVRFFTNNLEGTKFSGRSIDNVIIITPATEPPEGEPSFTVHQDPSDGAAGFKVGITRLFDPGTGDDASVSLGSFQAQLTYQDPSSNPSLPPGSRCVKILGVREMEIPITSPTIRRPGWRGDVWRVSYQRCIRSDRLRASPDTPDRQRESVVPGGPGGDLPQRC